MPSTLKDYKITDTKWFEKDPFLQEQIMAEYTKNQFKQIAPKLKERWKVKTWHDIAFYLAKAHLWWASAIFDNKSDGNITQNEYASKSTNIYDNLA